MTALTGERATYGQALTAATALLQPLDENRGSEYARGQVALIADLWGKDGMDTETRMFEVEIDLGLREPPEVLVRLPAGDWDALVEAVRRHHGIGDAKPGDLSRAASKVAQGEVLTDGPPAPAPRPPGTITAMEIEAMDLGDVLARLGVLKPQVAVAPLDAELDESVMRELITIGSVLDRWWHARTNDTSREAHAVLNARAWLYSHKLPTNYRP